MTMQNLKIEDKQPR